MLSYNAPHAKALSEAMRSYWSQDEEQLHGLHPEGLCDFFIRLRLSCFLRLSDLGVTRVWSTHKCSRTRGLQ